MAPRSEDPKLIISVINFELVQPICSGYRNVRDGRTDGRTDGRLYDSNTALALRASRGKNALRLIDELPTRCRHGRLFARLLRHHILHCS